ncbi:hypothetical protein [Streptosporangium sp. NBC_01469]|uniref:hypothetical protein n=1 Tax=Streptosporangium sp. NBC_01469 TaxID=2903898 RepID=UPI002E2BE33D|nr:hypothetical protein [Streptosporangium sp. NBC_01469]
MILWDHPPRCLSPHVLPARSHCEALTWHPPRGDTQVRVVRWTCDCDPLFYELCQAGGVRFIRRTRRSRSDLTIDETDRRPAAEADAMWIALLHGLVR